MEGHCLLERRVRPRSVHSGGQVEQQDVEIGTSGVCLPHGELVHVRDDIR